MCEPATIALITTGISLAVTVASTTASAVNQSKMANAQQRIAKTRATQAQEVAKLEADQHRMKLRRILGAQKSTFAAQNSRLGSGSPLQIMDDTATLGAWDEQMILYNGDLTAWGITQQSKLNTFQAQANITSTVLSGASDIIDTGTAGYLSVQNTNPTSAPVAASGVTGGGGGRSSFSGLVVKPGTFNPKTAGP